jgi:hypothetical protein
VSHFLALLLYGYSNNVTAAKDATATVTAAAAASIRKNTDKIMFCIISCSTFFFLLQIYSEKMFVLKGKIQNACNCKS